MTGPRTDATHHGCDSRAPHRKHNPPPPFLSLSLSLSSSLSPFLSFSISPSLLSFHICFFLAPSPPQLPFSMPLKTHRSCLAAGPVGKRFPGRGKSTRATLANSSDFFRGIDVDVPRHLEAGVALWISALLLMQRRMHQILQGKEAMLGGGWRSGTLSA